MPDMMQAGVGLVRPKPTANPTPKTRFREMGDSISKHRALLEMREFERAIDFALLEYQLRATSKIDNANAAMAVGYKIQGAIEFVDVLKTLSELPAPVKSAPTGNLDHKA